MLGFKLREFLDLENLHKFRRRELSLHMLRKAAVATSSPMLANIKPRQFSKFPILLSKVFERLCMSGVIKPMEPRSLPNTLLPNHNLKEFKNYHQQVGHNTGNCFRLKYAIQHLID